MPSLRERNLSCFTAWYAFSQNVPDLLWAFFNGLSILFSSFVRLKNGATTKTRLSCVAHFISISFKQSSSKNKFLSPRGFVPPLSKYSSLEIASIWTQHRISKSAMCGENVSIWELHGLVTSRPRSWVVISSVINMKLDTLMSSFSRLKYVCQKISDFFMQSILYVNL